MSTEPTTTLLLQATTGRSTEAAASEAPPKLRPRLRGRVATYEGAAAAERVCAGEDCGAGMQPAAAGTPARGAAARRSRRPVGRVGGDGTHGDGDVRRRGPRKVLPSAPLYCDRRERSLAPSKGRAGRAPPKRGPLAARLLRALPFRCRRALLTSALQTSGSTRQPSVAAPAAAVGGPRRPGARVGASEPSTVPRRIILHPR
mmetsp:Transcript_31092/g.107468  ORF Transcript_31092/g.107468 Transcript_31092/m.107468 type:complete len:202 (-) Transcript_31092:40-645(-)